MPYEVVFVDWETFEREFVDAFPQSTTRPVIFRHFSSYMEKLVSIVGTGFYQWIDGSFVSRKLNPCDIDFVTFIDAKTYTSNEGALDSLRDASRDEGLRLDGYFVKNTLRITSISFSLIWILSSGCTSSQKTPAKDTQRGLFN